MSAEQSRLTERYLHCDRCVSRTNVGSGLLKTGEEWSEGVLYEFLKCPSCERNGTIRGDPGSNLNSCLYTGCVISARQADHRARAAHRERRGDRR